MSHLEYNSRIKNVLNHGGYITLNGKAIEEKRKRKNLSLEDVAEQSGIDINTLKALERQHHLDISLADKLCECLDTNPEEILLSTQPSEPLLEIFHRVPDPIPFSTEEYGMRLREVRERQNLSQEYVAKKMNVSKMTISQIENAKTAKIDTDRACIFSDIYNCTVAYLLGSTDDPHGTTANKITPFCHVPESDRNHIAAMSRAYNRDPELWKDIIELLKSTEEQRDFCRYFIKVLLGYQSAKPSVSDSSFGSPSSSTPSTSQNPSK